MVSEQVIVPDTITSELETPVREKLAITDCSLPAIKALVSKINALPSLEIRVWDKLQFLSLDIMNSMGSSGNSETP